jgi:hypothetical protein
MAPRVRILASLCLALIFALADAALPTRATAADGDEARAMFLILLGKYVTWPADAFASPTSPIVVAVVGNGALANQMRTLAAGQQIEGRPVEVRAVSDAADGADAHIVFVSDSAQSQALASANSLRVIEGSSRLRDSDIAIQMEAGRVAFAVNRKDVNRRGLKLSSKLLRLASSFE